MRRLAALGVLGLLLAVSACGGSSADGSQVAGPVAADLARRSALVADLLEQGRPCAARREARALARAVESNTGDAVPVALSREIDPVVANLLAGIDCQPTASQPVATETTEPELPVSEPETSAQEERDSEQDDKKEKKPKKDGHGNSRGDGDD